MKRNIEERLANEISPLTEFLGANRVDDLKDKVCTLILDQVESDLRERDAHVLIYPDDIGEIVEEALAEVRNKIKKKFKDEFLAIAEKELARLSEKAGNAIEVTRCKDCTLCDTDQKSHCKYCFKMDMYVSDDDYCSFAVKREEEKCATNHQ